jgi:transcriptional regulator with XRE-family HTH domain
MDLTIGEKISALRRQKGMSQKQLAEHLMISPQAVSRWEQDENMPDVDNILRLSGIFDVSTDYLLKNGGVTSAHVPRGQDRDEKEDPFFLFDLDDDDDDDDDDYEDKYDADGKPLNFIISNIYGMATIAFLIIGLVWGYWHPGWIVFGIAWLIRTIANPRAGISLDSLALVIFLVIGFFGGRWGIAWIVFPIAWLLNSMIRDYRHQKEYKKAHENKERRQ